MPYEALSFVDVSALTRDWETIKNRYNAASFGTCGFHIAKNRDVVLKKGCTNPVIGDLPWSSPGEILWLSSDNNYNYEENMSEDFFDGSVFGVDKKGRILWLEYKTFYIDHFDVLERFFSNYGSAIAGWMKEMYEPGPTTFPRTFRDLGVKYDRKCPMDHVEITFYEFHGDTAVLSAVIDRIVENERACRG